VNSAPFLTKVPRLKAHKDVEGSRNVTFFRFFDLEALLPRGLESPEFSEFSALFDESTTVESA
jgi:hypothetical protein